MLPFYVCKANTELESCTEAYNNGGAAVLRGYLCVGPALRDTLLFFAAAARQLFLSSG